MGVHEIQSTQHGLWQTTLTDPLSRRLRPTFVATPVAQSVVYTGDQDLTNVLRSLFSIARKCEAQRKPFGPLEELHVQGEQAIDRLAIFRDGAWLAEWTSKGPKLRRCCGTLGYCR